MFTEVDDFDLKPYNIPDAQTSNTLEDFIDEQEKDRLTKILGTPFYSALVAGITEDPIPERWANVTDGCEYVYCGKKYKWAGLVETLRPFIYSEWTRVDETFIGNNGAAESKVENSTRVSAARLITQSWNEFARKIQGMPCREFEDSLYGMLRAKHLDYDADAASWGYANFLWYLCERFKFPGYKNVFNV